MIFEKKHEGLIFLNCLSHFKGYGIKKIYIQRNSKSNGI